MVGYNNIPGGAGEQLIKAIGADSTLRMIATSYSVGDKVHCPYFIDYAMICTTAGTTSTSSLSKADVAAGITAGTLTDGTVTWRLDLQLAAVMGRNPLNHNNILDIRDVTTLWDAGTISQRVQNGTFKDIYPGNYCEKTATIDGTAYNLKFVVADIDPFYAGYDSGYALVNQHHLGVVVFGLPNHVMNSTDTTAGGYYGSAGRAWLQNNVLPAIESVLGSSHLLQHKKLLSTDMDSTKQSRTPWVNGCASSWDWKDSKIDLLSEAQVYGNSPCSPSMCDIGEAYKQLALFRHVKPQVIGGSRTYWLRTVASAIAFALCGGNGVADAYDASATWFAPLPLILFK